MRPWLVLFAALALSALPLPAPAENPEEDEPEGWYLDGPNFHLGPLASEDACQATLKERAQAAEGGAAKPALACIYEKDFWLVYDVFMDALYTVSGPYETLGECLKVQAKDPSNEDITFCRRHKPER